MMTTLLLYILLGTLFCHVTFTKSLKSKDCGANHFFDVNFGKCKPCSICPDNQIIKNPCSDYSDLKCGPFYRDLSDFDSGTEISYPHSVEETLFEDDDSYYFGIKERRPAKEKAPSNEETNSPTTVEKEDREYWKTLAFALIGLLSVLIIVATIVVLLACRKLQRAAVMKQPDEGDMDDADSGYVVIRAIRNLATDSRPVNSDFSLYTQSEYEAHPPLLGASSSEGGGDSCMNCTSSHQVSGKLCFLPKVYKPQRRLLNYDADDVFESDDSAGSLRCATRTKLKTIIEKPDSNITDTCNV